MLVRDPDALVYHKGVQLKYYESTAHEDANPPKGTAFPGVTRWSVAENKQGYKKHDLDKPSQGIER